MLLTIIMQAQHAADAADAARTDKFMVVVAVIAVIFSGIVAYLISLDRKIKKLEDK